MNNAMQKTIFKLVLSIILLWGTSNTIYSQAKAGAQSSKFLILIETTRDGLKLTGQEGSAWKELTFTTELDQLQAIDQWGMTSLNRGKAAKAGNLANFLIIIKKTKEGISLVGKEGTAWTNLDFSCPNANCHQLIDFGGMYVKN